MNAWTKAAMLVVLLVAPVSLGQPLPHLHPNSFNGTPGEVLWQSVYRIVTGNMEYVLKRFGGGRTFPEGSREEICLRNRLSLWHLESVGPHMRGGPFNQMAVAIIKAALRDNDEPCDPDDKGPNAGLLVFQAWESSMSPPKRKAVVDALREQFNALGSRPLTPAEVAAIIAAALLAAPVLAPL